MTEFLHYLSFPFVRNAMLCTVLISLCASLLGTTLVLKRLSFIGDGLSHVAFGALAFATVLRISNTTLVVLPLTIIVAVILLRSGNGKIKGDAAIALLSVSALALGYLLMNLFPTSSNISGDVCSTLFGSSLILTLSAADVWLSVLLSAATIAFFLIFYNKIFAVTFDESFAAATGTRATIINYVISIIIALIIVLAMNLVGSLLISALIVFPVLSAMRLFKSFKSVTICSAVLGVFCSLTGLIISIILETPVGATIVVCQALVFVISLIIGKFAKR